MSALKWIMLGLSLWLPVLSQAADTWSACQTIVAVSDYQAYNGTVNVALSPGISGCSGNGITGAVEFAAGLDGVTTSNINSYLATTLAAFGAGRKVMILYDNSSSNCNSAAVAVGGFSGQC